MRVLFPDTNFFLEFRKAIDLPWHELDGSQPGEGPDIRLIIPSTVVTEIERHKTNGNSRKAKRARTTSAAFRQALVSPRHVTELRAANPRIILELPPVVKVDFTQFPNLDPARPDHRIAAEYAEVRKAEPDLRVLSDDTLAILAVRSLGFEPLLIPENWRLAPEKDERDDEIDRLRMEVTTYKQSAPQISIRVLSDNGEDTNTIAAKVETFALEEGDIERTVALMQAHSPIERDFKRSPTSIPMSFGFGQTWQEPKAEEIENYKTRDYPNWLDSIRKSVPTVVRQLNVISHEIPFTVRLANTGFVNATDVRLTITAFDGVTLLDSLSEEQASARNDKIRFPAPPRPPRGQFVSIGSLYRFERSDLTADFARFRGPPSRDPNEFYYFGGRPNAYSEELVLTCAAFPHQQDPYDLGFRIVIPEPKELGKRPRLRIRVQASNLRRPVEEYADIAIAFEQGDTMKIIKSTKYQTENR